MFEKHTSEKKQMETGKQRSQNITASRKKQTNKQTNKSVTKQKAKKKQSENNKEKAKSTKQQRTKSERVKSNERSINPHVNKITLQQQQQRKRFAEILAKQ